MPTALQPEAAAFLAAAAETDRPSVHLMPLAAARESFERESAPAEAPPRIQEIVDVTIGGELGARLYRPEPGVLPVVVFFHGGGWVLGSVATHDQMCRVLARESGCAVVSVDYRRAPEHPYPAAVDDAAAALEWVRVHGHEHRLDPVRLAVAGDSAGGNIAAAAAIRSRGAGRHLLLQLLYYPVTTTDLGSGTDPDYDGLVLCRDELMWHQDQYLPRETDRRLPEASPSDCADLAGMPGAVIIAAECDPIAPQSHRYAEALRAAGVDVSLHTYPGMIHGFAQYPDRFEAAVAALRQGGAALNRALSKPRLTRAGPR